MTANVVTDLLSAPLSPDWTIEGLAEQLLEAIAAQPEQEFVLDGAETTDRQSRRLIRPLLACLANMSATESGTSNDIFGGKLSFKRMGPTGPVWILGEFENSQGSARVTFHRSFSSPQNSEPTGQNAGTQASAIILSRSVKEGTSPAVSQPERSTITDKRRIAELWASSFAKSASMGVATGSSVGEVHPSDIPLHAVTMCYEIGRIYRDDWSRVDAERLARTLPIRDHSGLGAAAGAVFGLLISPVWAFTGAILGASLESSNNNNNERSLLSMSEVIIKHFESGR